MRIFNGSKLNVASGSNILGQWVLPHGIPYLVICVIHCPLYFLRRNYRHIFLIYIWLILCLRRFDLLLIYVLCFFFLSLFISFYNYFINILMFFHSFPPPRSLPLPSFPLLSLSHDITILPFLCFLSLLLLPGNGSCIRILKF